jgi:hypothetical protein
MLLAGRYAPADMLGEGAFAEVWAGTDLQTGQPIAIKMESKQPPSEMLSH